MEEDGKGWNGSEERVQVQRIQAVGLGGRQRTWRLVQEQLSEWRFGMSPWLRKAFSVQLVYIQFISMFCRAVESYFERRIIWRITWFRRNSVVRMTYPRASQNSEMAPDIPAPWCTPVWSPHLWYRQDSEGGGTPSCDQAGVWWRGRILQIKWLEVCPVFLRTSFLFCWFSYLFSISLISPLNFMISPACFGFNLIFSFSFPRVEA